MKKQQPTVNECARKLIAIVREGGRPSPRCRAAITACEVALQRVSESRSLASKHAGPPPLAAEIVQKIRDSAEPIAATARRLGIDRKTVRKYRQP